MRYDPPTIITMKINYLREFLNVKFRYISFQLAQNIYSPWLYVCSKLILWQQRELSDRTTTFIGWQLTLVPFFYMSFDWLGILPPIP